jgi:hypothetical protein
VDFIHMTVFSTCLMSRYVWESLDHFAREISVTWTIKRDRILVFNSSIQIQSNI